MRPKRIPRIKQKFACGTTAGRFCIKYFLGEEVKEKILIDEMESVKLEGEGGDKYYYTLPPKFMKCLRAHGLKCRGQHGMSIKSLTNNLQKGRLVVCCFWDHYYTAFKCDDETVTFYSGLEGEIKMSLKSFDSKWIDKDINGKIYNSYGIVVSR